MDNFISIDNVKEGFSTVSSKLSNVIQNQDKSLDKLKKLHDLYTSGVINEEEFNNLKKKELSKIE
jgi:hypothetical protein